MVNMRPQGGPGNPPSDILQAYVLLAVHGGLAEHVPNQKWLVLQLFYKLFQAPLQTFTLALSIPYLQIGDFIRAL